MSNLPSIHYQALRHKRVQIQEIPRKFKADDRAFWLIHGANGKFVLKGQVESVAGGAYNLSASTLIFTSCNLQSTRFENLDTDIRVALVFCGSPKKWVQRRSCKCQCPHFV